MENQSSQKEIWKPMIGFTNAYEVSNKGRVRSLDRRVKTRAGIRHYRGKILKLSVGTTGYYSVVVCFGRRSRPRRREVHRIVAEAFIGSSTLHVNHKDGNKLNNNISNLEYCTPLQNNQHSRTVLHPKKRGAFLKRDNRVNKYYSQLRHAGKVLCLGHFDTKDKAYEAYFNKYVELFGHEPWSKE